jgi:putative ABC transport system permease protein
VTALRGAASLRGFTLVALHRLRFERGASAATLVVVACTAFLFGAMPRAFDRVSERGLRYTLEHADPLERNFSLVAPGRERPAAPDAGIASVLRREQRELRALPAALSATASRETAVVSTPRYDVVGGVPAIPNVTRILTLRLPEGVEPHVRLVSGRWPRPTNREATVSTPTVPGTAARRVPVLEIALSRATVTQMRLHVGDRLVLFPDQSAPAVLNVPFVDQRPLALDLVGVYGVRDPEAPYWFSDQTFALPQVESTQDLQTSTWIGAALVFPDQYRDLLRATAPFLLAYENRFFVDPRRVHAAAAGRLEDATRELSVRYASPSALAPQLQLQLGALLADYRAARAQAETLLAIAAIGLLACALAVVGLLAALANERRRVATALARARGASPLDVLAAQAAEGVALAAPAGAAGWLAARLALPAYPSTLSWCLVVALVAGTVVLFVASIARLARREVRPPARDEVVVAPLAPRRLVLEGLVVVLALGGLYLLRRRGLASSGDGGFDVYLAGVPVLLGLAAGIVALRLYPLPLRALAVVARRRRGIVLPLALSRSAREHGVSAVPLLVLLLAVAVAIFSAVMLRTVEAAQEQAAWREVGADVRIDAAEDGSLPPSLASRLEQLGATVAAAYARPVGPAGSQAPLLVALDPAAFERVVSGTPNELRFPPPSPSRRRSRSGSPRWSRRSGRSGPPRCRPRAAGRSR